MFPALNVVRCATVLGALLALSACADMVPLKPGADAVHVMDLPATSGCKLLGSTHVSVLDKVGPFNRTVRGVEENLAQMARNSALDLGGDTVAAAGPVVDGAREYQVFRCR